MIAVVTTSVEVVASPPAVGESVGSVGSTAIWSTLSVADDESLVSAPAVASESLEDTETESSVLVASGAGVVESPAGGGSGKITGVTTGSVPVSPPLVGESVGSVGSTPIWSTLPAVSDESVVSVLVVALAASSVVPA